MNKKNIYNYGLTYEFPIKKSNLNNPMCKIYSINKGIVDINLITEKSTSITPPYTPANIRQAYNMNNITGNPTGKNIIIAIIDAYAYANVTTDLTTYCNQFGLKTPNIITNTASLTANAPAGKFNFMVKKMSSFTAQNTGWALEQALDIQMAHAVAPDAGILLVQATSASYSALSNAIQYAINAGAKIISLSWGSGEFSSEANYTIFNNNNVIFTVSSGDDPSVSFPSANNNVISVGGTNLINTDGIWSETGWNSSGGGVSQYIPVKYQNLAFNTQYGPQTNTKRQTPDISCVADPDTGVYVRFNNQWYQVGGTSASAPIMAGIIALANQIRKTNNKLALTSSVLLTGLYNMIKNAVVNTYPNSLNDVVSGTSGTNSAITGYDLITGCGTPKCTNFVPYLAGL